MKPNYDKTQIMKSAWYLFKVSTGKTFAQCLKKAWNNFRYAMHALAAEGRNYAEELRKAREEAKNAQAWTPVPVPDGYYGVRGRYYGD